MCRMTSVLIKTWSHGNKRPRENAKMEAEIRVVHPQVKEGQGLPASTKSW